MLKQTVQSPDRNMVLNFGDKTSVIELGTFWDIVHAHPNIKLTYTFTTVSPTA